MESMSWLIFGAGAIGTYIGGSLALLSQAGGSPQRVVFVERPEVAAQVRPRGLRLNLNGEEHTIASPHITGSLPEALALGPFDAAILALKSYDTQPFITGLGEAARSLPPILCLQNGVENESLLEFALGQGKVIAGTVTSAVGRREAGDIVLERKRGMGVAGGYPLSERLAAALSQAGLNAQIFPRPQDMKWSKMLTNLLANASSAILNLTPAQIFADPRLFRLERQQLREALSVMAALGIGVVDLPGTPVRLLGFAVRALPAGLSRPLLQRAVGKGRGSKMPSFHIDLHSGRRLSEVDYLNGAIVRFGAQAGVETPVNRLLNETLLSLTRGEIALETFAHQPEKLLKGLSRL
jgi:2-dehydropantoate 2-reductase